MSNCSTLLIIEDSADDRFLYRRLLSRFPHDFTQIDEVETAEAALEYLKRQRPDCCLLDYQLPGMNGLTFLKRLRDAYATNPIPVVVLTGQGDESLAVSLMQQGAHDYLIKGTLTAKTFFKAITHAIQSCQLQRQLHQMAYYDALTGLLSRAAFLEHLNEAVFKAKRTGNECALFYLDLDHFKQINDTRGHDAGDQLLKTVAQRIQTQVRVTDAVGRLGGDEFVILLEKVDIGTSDLIADKILSAIAQPIALGDTEITASASLGIAHYPETAMNWQELLKYADLALYEAKLQGRAKHHHFSPQQKKQWLRRRTMEAALPYAITQREIQFHYLPIVSTKDRHIVGFELLSRWHVADSSDLAATELIEMVENLRLVESLNEYLLAHACHQLSLWKQSHPRLILALNIAGSRWQHGSLIEQVRTQVARYQVDPALLQIEVNELMLMRYPELCTDLLGQLKELGVRIALDNFGGGAISLCNLADVPLDCMKIDRRFWINAFTGKRNRKVIESAIALGRSLDLNITAEGVQEEAQWKLARELGCDHAQGFWLGAPHPDWRFFSNRLTPMAAVTEQSG